MSNPFSSLDQWHSTLREEVQRSTEPTQRPKSWHETTDALRRPPWLMPFRDGLFTTGLILLGLSAGLFGVYAYWLRGNPQSPDFLLFMFHFSLAVGYGLILMTNGMLKFRRQTAVTQRACRWLMLLLFLVSAFALNRTMSVFQESTEWLCGAVVLAGGAITAYAWTPFLGVRTQQGVYFLLAGSLWLFVYQSAYVADWYPVGLLGLLLFGISIHIYIPLLLSVTLGRRLWADYRASEHLRPAIWAGLLLPPLTVFLFLIAWSQTLTRIENARNEATLRRTEDLPEWAFVAQRIDAHNPTTRWFLNRMLGLGLNFDEGPSADRWGDFGRLTALDDAKQHDPLLLIANQLLPPALLTKEDRINLLKVVNNDRHLTQEKFWSGRHLITQNVVTQTRIWPQFRLAYTEKTIRIRNTAQTQSGEALYTFHLPTGSVITSMSLWVNGQEEKARLTTVAKADSAYRQVVNVESKHVERDPVVVYWQEGSRVTLRVFPCPARQERQVKLGVTSPLQLDGSDLIYENSWFEGPDASEAGETGQIDFDQQPVGLSAPIAFDKGAGGQLRYQGNYKSDWSLRMRAPALSPEPFVLDGVAYQLAPYQPKQAQFEPERVYLDLNTSWSLAEFETVWRAVRHKPVFVFADGLVQLTDDNRMGYFERLSEQTFSLFPIYRIPHPDRALLLTQAGNRSLFLDDLKGSPFADRITKNGGQKATLRTLNLSPETAGYLKTLSEFGAVHLVPATAETVAAGLGLKSFPLLQKQADAVVLPGAGMVCKTSKVSPEQASVAPDHLARLFGYNHLISSIGQQYFDTSYRQKESLLVQAQHAHVLSPLSSLIVLETQADYDRFGIQKDQNGLANATLKEEGAVPEPHEWAMLILFVGLVLWLRWRKAHA